MKHVGHTITDADLLAFADGETSSASEAEVLTHLEDAPADAERVDTWRRQADVIRAAFQSIAAEPLPVSLSLSHPRPVRVSEERKPDLSAPIQEPLRFERRNPHRHAKAQAGVVAATLAIGGALALFIAVELGFTPSIPALLRPVYVPAAEAPAPGDQSLQLARRAGEAHRAYASAKELQHPGEITLAQDPALALWLSRRVGVAIRIPDLAPEGLRFSGGRITPGELGPAAFLLYESQAGERVGLFVARIVSEEKSAPQYREERATATLTWTSGGAGLVLSAAGDQDRLRRLWRLVPGNS